MLTRKMFESRLSEMPFPGLLMDRILMVIKRHCAISEAINTVTPEAISHRFMQSVGILLL
jgi:hypothetical protein